jgi:RHS repeat-associated protein
VAEAIRRVKFTGKERDGESGLDYFGARYLSGVMGRWTSPDAPFADQHPADPQSWNLYSYVRNNPLRFIDPTGQYVCVSMTSAQCDSLDQALQDAQKAANSIKSLYGAKSQQYTDAQRAIDAYGVRGVDNGVAVTLGSVRNGAAAQVEVGGNRLPQTGDNPNGQNILVTFDPGSFGQTAGTIGLAITAAHEGSHVADGSAFTASGFNTNANPTQYQTEMRAFGVTAAIAEGSGLYTNGFAFGSNLPIWQPGWTASQVQQGIQSYLALPGLYGYTPTSQGGRAFSRRTKVVR